MLVILKCLIVLCILCPISIKAFPRRPINSDFVNGQWARIGKRNQQKDINIYMHKNKITENQVSNIMENFCSKKAILSQNDDDLETYINSNYI